MNASWLFELLDLDPALAGDLLEERGRGRSAIWYWRQVLVAIWIGIWGAIRDHKVLALRAVITGFAMEYFLLFLRGFIGYDLPLTSISNWIGNLSLILLTQAATGRVVALTHRAHPIPMVSVFLMCFLPWQFGPQLAWARTMLVDWDRIDPAYRPYVPYFLACVFVTIIGVLLGGTQTPKKEHAASSRQCR